MPDSDVDQQQLLRRTDELDQRLRALLLELVTAEERVGHLLRRAGGTTDEAGAERHLQAADRYRVLLAHLSVPLPT